ncbi:MAG TPA: right-handed parallel beta-helix repeat-containing protein [Actinomycetota bacterium]|nr:right-handed parallel beta-helix repeat-containing protein [Actinomycetota bacterium]
MKARRLLVLLAAMTLVAPLTTPAQAASQSVATRDNRFDPQEVRINPGDTVVWSNQGARTHDINSDKRGQFDSGRMKPGTTFSQTFGEAGYYYYFCSIHGAKRKVGMWGLVVVGDPPASEDPYLNGAGGKDQRPTIVVPKEEPTIQKAVDKAREGARIVIQPGVYHEAVHVTTNDLLIEGVDRFRTIIHGQDKRNNGFVVDGARGVTIQNLTVRNHLGNGIYYNNSRDYTIQRIDSIKNRTYGIYAFDSYGGVIRNSFGWGSGDSAFYIGQCLGCSALIENVQSHYNYLGYSGTNATGVVIRSSLFSRNGAGIVPNTLPTEELGPNRGTIMYNNRVLNNNYETIPAAGFSETVGIPYGTGIWMPGVENNVAVNNIVKNHRSYGILITPSVDSDLPMNNTVIDNFIRNSDSDNDGYGYDLAWDGEGADNCFSGNDFKGETGPPEIETLYACENRPFAGIPFSPVSAHVAAAATSVATRDQEEPPEPKRPRCQRGAPGCDIGKKEARRMRRHSAGRP